MELYKPTATLFLDTRKSKTNGKYPLKLTIYCRPEKRRYRTAIDLSLEEWEKINNKRLKDEKLKETKIKINAILSKSEKILESLSPFSFQAFEAIMFVSAIGKIDLSLEHWFKEYGKLLEFQGREGSRISYNTTYNSLIRFKKDLKLTDITKEFLEDYETHMTGLGKSSSTIGIYLRHLRAIINRAIKKGILKQENYPFKGFEIPATRNIKKALTDEQLQLLLNHTPSDEKQARALDFWVFSYLCNGMNFTDIAHLAPININGNFLHFIRRKTIRTKKKDLRPIKVALHPKALGIVNKYKNTDPKNPFLFPVLEAGLSAKTTKHRIQKFIKQVNEEMDKIRKELKFENKVGTYVARHSFSSRLMRKGASTQYIKDSLGHSTVAVTENYLGDFADNVKQEYTNFLTDFV
jgi:integrase